MFEETIKKEVDKDIERTNALWLEKIGREMTYEEICIYKLGMSSGIRIAAIGLVDSDVDLFD